MSLYDLGDALRQAEQVFDEHDLVAAVDLAIEQATTDLDCFEGTEEHTYFHPQVTGGHLLSLVEHQQQLARASSQQE